MSTIEYSLVCHFCQRPTNRPPSSGEVLCEFCAAEDARRLGRANGVIAQMTSKVHSTMMRQLERERSGLGHCWNDPSPKVESVKREAQIRRELREEAVQRGPRLAAHAGTGELHIWVPSPHKDARLIAELRRWGFEWFFNGGLVVWHRPVTPGKEAAALKWARSLYAEVFGGTPPPIQEVMP